jgi:hypothetical protein
MLTLDIISQRKDRGELVIGAHPSTARTTLADLPEELLLQIREQLFYVNLDEICRRCPSDDTAKETEQANTSTGARKSDPPWSKPNWLGLSYIPKPVKLRREFEIVNDCLIRFGCIALYAPSGSPIPPSPLIITHITPAEAMINVFPRHNYNMWTRFYILDHLFEYHEIPFPTGEQKEVYKRLFKELALQPLDPTRLVPTAVYVSPDVVLELLCS